MATSRYSLDITLPSGHTSDITVLQFSPDGKFLASGSGDGVTLVFSTSSWKPVKRFVDASSINTLAWHPVIPKTLICGYTSGDVHTTRFESHQLADAGSKVWTDRMDGPVHRIAIAETGTKIAIAYGREVVVFEQNTLSSWTHPLKLPDPPSLPGLDEQLPASTASSLHFIDDGKVLIVSYSDHGIVCWDLGSLELRWHITPRACSIGYSTVSSDEKVVVVSNLYDGLDWYKIPDRTFSRSVPVRIAKNVIIPVQFVDRDTLLITGGTSGVAKVLDARTAETLQILDHDSDDVIQAIAFHMSLKSGKRYIATGTSGGRSIIHIWISKVEITEPPAEPKTESPAPTPPTALEEPWLLRNQRIPNIALAIIAIFTILYLPAARHASSEAWHTLLRLVAPVIRSVLEYVEKGGNAKSLKTSAVQV